MLGVFGQMGTVFAATAQMLPLALATTLSPIQTTPTEDPLSISDGVLEDGPSKTTLPITVEGVPAEELQQFSDTLAANTQSAKTATRFGDVAAFLLFTTLPLASRRRPSPETYLRLAKSSRARESRSEQIFYLYRASSVFAAEGDLEKAEHWMREAYGVIRRYSPDDVLFFPVLQAHKKLAETTGHYWSAANRSKKIAKLLKKIDPMQAKFYAEEALRLYDKVLRHRSTYARRAPGLDLDAEIEKSKASVRTTLAEIGAKN